MTAPLAIAQDTLAGEGASSRRTSTETTLRSTRHLVALAGVLILQLLCSLLLQNSAFQDEALYLYAGRSQILGTSEEGFGAYFSGLPFLYPVIAGAIDLLGGLEAARAFSLLCALGTSALVYAIGRKLYSPGAGLLGAALFATASPILFIGRLATYDAISVFLIALATVLAIGAARGPEWRTLAAVAACAVAVGSKYAAAGFVPIVGLLLLSAAGHTLGTRSRTIIAGVVGVTVFAATAWFIASSFPDVVEGLTRTTADREVIRSEAAASILVRANTLAGPIALVALVGLVLILFRRAGGRAGSAMAFRSCVLFAGVLIAPAYHVVTGELTSLDKHLAYSALFAAPLAGVALARLGRMQMGWLGVSAILVASIVVGLDQARAMHGAWPNSEPLISALRNSVRANDTRILVEEVEVPKYYLVDRIALNWQFTGLDYIEYETPDGEVLTGLEGYERAIADGYFGIIAFRFGPSAELATELSSAIESSGKYELIVSEPFTTSRGTGSYTIWRQLSTDTEQE